MPTAIKAALKKWEETTGKKANEAVEVKLIGVYPPIEKMDHTLGALTSCEKLSLSTNMITNIQNLQNLKCLKILSLGRNLVKSLAGEKDSSCNPANDCITGIEAVGETLEQLWISYNKIGNLGPLAKMEKLTTLYMAHNLVK